MTYIHDQITRCLKSRQPVVLLLSHRIGADRELDVTIGYARTLLGVPGTYSGNNSQYTVAKAIYHSQ